MALVVRIFMASFPAMAIQERPTVRLTAGAARKDMSFGAVLTVQGPACIS